METRNEYLEVVNDFFEAITKGDQARVVALLERDPTLVKAKNAQGLSPVLVAVYYGEPEIAELLIARGAPLNIFEASAAGRVNRVRELVEAQPELVNAYAEDGFFPLGLAAYFGHRELVVFLLEHGARVDARAKNSLQVMALHSAASGGHTEIAELLLKYGADPNARQENDFAPLHSAAQNHQLDMIRLLLSYGADPAARSADGRTALDFAGEAAPQEVLDLLRGG
jgi:ankyrin repeat protein